MERSTLKVKHFAQEHNTVTRPGLEPRPLNPEFSSLTTHGHCICVYVNMCLTYNAFISILGWDISSLNIADATERAEVLDYGLQRQLRPYLEKMTPRRSIYCPDFIAANQVDRADNILSGSKQEMMEQIREDIRDFKQKNNLDKVGFKTEF